MKFLLRHTLYYVAALAILPFFLSSFKLSGGVLMYLIAGILMTVFFYILKPILSIVSFPISLFTGGIINIVVNLILLYLVTIFLPQVQILNGTLYGFSLLGVSISSIALNRLLSYVLCSVIITVFIGLISWVQE